jgi:hypothetical protein
MAVHQDRAEKERGAKNKFIERTIGVWQSRSRQDNCEARQMARTYDFFGFFQVIRRTPREESLKNCLDKNMSVIYFHQKSAHEKRRGEQGRKYCTERYS